MNEYAPFRPAIFRPFWKTINPQTHAVIVAGQERTDYRLEYDKDGQKVVFDELSYDEACHLQIVPRGRK